MDNFNFKDYEIFAFSGKLGVGKNFISEKVFIPFLEKKNTLVIALSDHFKVETIVKDGFDYTKVYFKKDETTRVALQKRGTEEGRDIFGQDVWLETIKTWIRVYAERGVERFIITDVRFKNEFFGLRQIGAKIFRVVAPRRNHDKLLEESENKKDLFEIIKNHKSETDLDGIDFNNVIHNDYEDNPFVEVRDYIRSYYENKKKEHVIFIDLDNTICECNEYYKKCVHKLHDLLLDYIDTSKINNEEFNEIFYQKYYQIDGEYYKNVFRLENFSERLINVYKSIKEYLIISQEGDIELQKKVFKVGMSVFDYNYEPLPHALEVIKELESYAKIVILTMGDKYEQIKKIVYLGLSNLDFYITKFKNKQNFIELMNKYHAIDYYMIGDTYCRDIETAHDAGINNLYWINHEDLYTKEENKLNLKEYKSLKEIEEDIKLKLKKL